MTVVRDALHAARSLVRDRVFTLVCVISLGIGMGAVVALTTLARGIASPARGVNPDGLVELLVVPEGRLRVKAGQSALEAWSYPDYQALRESGAGVSITGWTRQVSEVGEPTSGDATPQRVAALYVSANYFSTFGVSLERGPGFDPAIDDATSGPPRVVVGHSFWRSRMTSDPDAVGKTLTIDGAPHTVVGIAPEEFRGHFNFFNAPDSLLFVPLERHPRLREHPDLRSDRAVDWVHIHGRLEPGVNIRRANAAVSAIASGLARDYPATNEFKAAAVEAYRSLGAVPWRQSRRALTLILALAGGVLVVVCVNISGMMLVRGTSRERELCIRAALGASRRRLVQHLFLEAVLLALAGAVLSGFDLFGIPALAAWWIGLPIPRELDLDAAGVAISSGLCLLVSVLFGLLPALRFSRPDLVGPLKEDVGGGRRQAIRVHRAAAMVQIGVAIPFLVLSGVLLDRVRTAEFGFPTDGLAAVRLPAAVGSNREADFAIRTVRDNLQGADGVRSVTVADGMPIDFVNRRFRVGRAGGNRFVTAQVTRVGENFLETIGVPILRGRSISADDRVRNTPVAVVSEPLAELLFGGTDPLDERITVTLDEGREATFTVVGVTADFATAQLTTERPQLLLPLSEALPPAVHLIARGGPGDEPRLRAVLENAVRELEVEPLPSGADVFRGVVTGQDLVRKSFADLIWESMAMGVAGGLVLVLAALGIVGVVGFMVVTRTRELAVRTALGATRARLFGLIFADIVRLAIPGVACGLLLGGILIHTLDTVMSTPLTVGPSSLGVMEPVIYASASAIAVLVALMAGIPAARRATSVDPMVAIRSE